MPAPPFNNLFHRRQVAASSAKSCFVCYKPSETCLVSSDGKSDFFYCCAQHLQDGKFATPQPDEEVEAAKVQKQKLEQEIDTLKKKWEERKKKKDESKEDKKKKEDDQKEQENKKETEIDRLNKIVDRPPRAFVLNQDIYNMRLAQYRDKQRSKQTAQMLSKPALFPQVPKHDPASTSGSSTPSGNTQ